MCSHRLAIVAKQNQAVLADQTRLTCSRDLQRLPFSCGAIIH